MQFRECFPFKPCSRYDKEVLVPDPKYLCFPCSSDLWGGMSLSMWHEGGPKGQLLFSVSSETLHDSNSSSGVFLGQTVSPIFVWVSLLTKFVKGKHSIATREMECKREWCIVLFFLRVMSVSFEDSDAFYYSLFGALYLISISLSLRSPLRGLLGLLLAFVLVRPTIRGFYRIYLLYRGSNAPTSVMGVLRRSPKGLVFCVKVQLVVRYRRVVFRNFPNAPLFLPSVSRGLMCLSLPFLVSRGTTSLLYRVFRLTLFLATRSPNATLYRYFKVTRSLPYANGYLFMR